MYCFLKYSVEELKSLSFVSKVSAASTVTESSKKLSTALRLETAAISMPDFQELIINPECPAQILIDYVSETVGFDKESEFDFCNDAGKLCSIKSLLPWKKASHVMDHLGVYFIIMYNQDKYGNLTIEPMLRRNTKLYNEIVNKVETCKNSSKCSLVSKLKRKNSKQRSAKRIIN